MLRGENRATTCSHSAHNMKIPAYPGRTRFREAQGKPISSFPDTDTMRGPCPATRHFLGAQQVNCFHPLTSSPYPPPSMYSVQVWCAWLKLVWLSQTRHALNQNDRTQDTIERPHAELQPHQDCDQHIPWNSHVRERDIPDETIHDPHH